MPTDVFERGHVVVGGPHAHAITITDIARMGMAPVQGLVFGFRANGYLISISFFSLRSSFISLRSSPQHRSQVAPEGTGVMRLTPDGSLALKFTDQPFAAEDGRNPAFSGSG